MAQNHNDIYSIVERLAILEGRITPATVKHGLNNQQKSVPQMPALFKPKTQKILGGDADDKNPMSGYAVGGCEESEEEKTPVLEAEVAEDVLEKVREGLSTSLALPSLDEREGSSSFSLYGIYIMIIIYFLAIQ